MTAGGRNRLDDSVRKQALQLAKDGHTVRQIAHKLHLSMSTVRAWVQHRKEEKPTDLSESLKLLHAWPSGSAVFVFDGDDPAAGRSGNH